MSGSQSLKAAFEEMPHIAPVSNVDQSLLAHHVRDARLMLAYLAQSNNETAPNEFAHLIESCRMPLSDWDCEREVLFWQQLHALARTIHPATIETIEVNSDIVDPSDPQVAEKRQQKKRVVRHFSWFGLLTILVVLLVQIYWVIGSNVVSRTQDVQAELAKIKNEENALVERITRLEERLQRQRRLAAVAENDIDVNLMEAELARLTGEDRQNLNAQRDSANEKISSLYATMGWTTLGLPGLLADPRTKEQVYLEFQKILNAAAVQYCLPLLLGLLGACVYVLREIFHANLRKTFLPEHAVGHRLRLYLGMIAGLTFAWLFAWVLPRGEEAGLGAASPLAIAFLVGYSVDILFSALDRAKASIAKNKLGGEPA